MKYFHYEEPKTGSMIRFERISSSPDSISFSKYAHDTLLSSGNYKVILIYQTQWGLCNDENSIISISFYKEEMVLGIHNCAFCGGYAYVRTNPLEISSHYVLPFQLVLYPNPCTQSFSIQENFAVSKIEIIDLNGQVRWIKNPLEEDDKTIDMTGLPKGVYSVRSISKNACISAKIIKE